MRQNIKILYFFSLLLFFIGFEATSEELTLSLNNVSSYKPLLRTADRIQIERGALEINLSEEFNQKASMARVLLESKQSEASSKSYPSIGEFKSLLENNLKLSANYEADFSLKLVKLGKEITGKLSFIKGDENSSLLSLRVINSKENKPYIFWLNGKSFSILSPISGRCREIPWEGISDPILSSGLSLDQIFFNFGPESLIKVSILEDFDQLVPDPIGVEQLVDSSQKISLIQVPKYSVKNVYRLKTVALSNLFKRTVAIVDSDSRTGLPYQVQYEVDTVKKIRGILNYSWLRLSDGFYLPRTIEYFEYKNDLDPISTFEIRSIYKSSTSKEQFLEEKSQFCPKEK